MIQTGSMKFFLSGLVILVVGFCSCQREIDWPVVADAGSDSSFLSKVVYRDTTLPSGADTFQITLFSYDNSKRLSRMLSYYDYAGAIDTFIYDFRYAGADSLPFLMIEKDINYNGPGTSSTDSFYYTYSGPAVAKDSAVRWIYPSASYDGTLVHQFSVNGSVARMYIKEYAYVGSVLTMLNYDSAFYNMGLASGNISAQSYLDGGSAFYNSLQALYDNRPNPFRKIIKFKFHCFENVPFGSYSIQQNNPLQVQYDRFFMTDNESYTYVYRSDGYPVSGTLLSVSGLAGYNKVQYIYRTL